MLISQYAGVGETCPLFTTTVSSGGTLTAGSLYFSFQLQNRAGFNIPSVSSQVTYTTNQKVVVTIPESVRKDGWDIHYYIISAGATSDPSTHVQIARVPNYQYGESVDPQSLEIELPFTLELTKDIHLALATTIATLTNFPTGSDRLDGQVRWVTATSKWYEYRADSDLPVDPENTDVIAADVGQWVRIGGASTYVSNTRSGVGSDRPIASINPSTTIPTPKYPGQTLGKYLPSWEARYWIYNGNANPVPAGTEFGIELEYNNKRSPNLLNGLFMVKFIGFVGTDGEIRTEDADEIEFKNYGAYFSWSPKISTPFVTSDDLQPGEAIALAVKPFFASHELDDGSSSVTPGAIVGVYPVTRTQSGDYNPLGKLLPNNTVYDIDEKYRVVPNIGLTFDILSGTAIVGSYDFPSKPRRTFGGLAANTSGQKIIINGNSAVYPELAAYTPSASEDIRAIVSTEEGESDPGAWSSYQAVTLGQSLAVTVNYPCTSGGVGTVRADYPDVIAGNTKGLFNPAYVNVYLQRQDTLEIRKFSGSLVVAGTSQTVTITVWTSGTIASLPNAADDFSLFAAGTSVVALIGSGGDIPATSYRACYSFEYDGNQITKISHASPPCIYEWEGDFEPPTVEVNPEITILDAGEDAIVVNTGTPSHAYLTFSLPIPEGGGTANFDDILTDSNGDILVDSNGNVVSL